ncbi:Na+/H+ antiporter NhaC family protein [Campylobacter upsaliensis]|uniref:Na+/H+ antiporter NhaC family protein n=1 Tax=Campylobacter upsaliensis TaxID=28080 RepID=UPI00004B3190|nr:Na+/H+ antiporter NhaC family protein [Campylobacter upsaliensis]EAL53820.1 probable integral membrane protein Cj0832c [Campylobacter upsaliensis RM3195]MCR2107242.1 Na+/H+ antiporter NhaC family protein [Campylobacter upsaliensis]MCR2112800.1 Na+/H+ antiporter NhaC family protein [Campylobacter upsaliensis]MCR2119710.1 Na+/H+ antiporter NhaC family protein [Campylobacter upsaliensis]MCR2124503.1 Na+/H+ antiporter NhaC family protein [Campylobacter upsaliensis]
MKFLAFCLLPIALFADAKVNAEFYGFITLLPPFIAIILAFITKDVILSLFMGVLSGTFLLSLASNIFFVDTIALINIYDTLVESFSKIISYVLKSTSDPVNAGIILQILCIGGLVALITKMGGAKAIALQFAKRAKTAISAQLNTWFIGLLIFFDDYANLLIVGPIMRPLADKFKISREKFAFIIDSTAAPVAGIAIISTWIGLEVSLIKNAYASIGIDNISAFGIFVETIPYRFYNIFMLFFVALTAIMGREFGSMYAAQIRAKTTGQIAPVSKSAALDTAELEDQFLAPKDGIKIRAFDAIIPVMTLIILAILGFYFNGFSLLEGEELANAKANPLSFETLRSAFGSADSSIVLFQAALFAAIVAIFIGVRRRIFNIKEAIETWIYGWKTMIFTIVLLLLAWSLSSIVKDLGTSTFITHLLADKLPEFILPATIFAFASLISFAIGTSYGTMGVLMPLAVPLAFEVAKLNGLEGEALHHYMVLNISCVLTGAIFGNHCSPISDNVILSSMSAKCDHMEHVRTQIPYALFICAISLFTGYIPTALGLSVWLVLPLNFILIALLLRIIGKKV